MKMNLPKQLFSALLGSTLVLLAQTTIAQTWQTVDDFQYVAGQDAGNAGLALAPNGTLFAAGWAFDGPTGVGHALVMASTDGGTTWSAPLDDFTYAPGDSAYYNAIASDAAGYLYAAGEMDNAANNTQNWFLRRSADGGLTWSTVDLLTGASGNTAANKIAADASGNVYVAGIVADNWVVRKGFGGTNFTTVDSFAAGAYGAQAVFVHPTAGIFAAGNASNWVVRRSKDGGATWSTIDSFSLSAGSGAIAFGIGADAHGNLYVVGSADSVSGSGRKQTTSSHWLVRKSSDGGNSWTTVDNTLSVAGYGWYSAACSFAADSNGNLFVAGFSFPNWIVRENPGGAGTWQTVDTFKYTGTAQPSTAAADSSGHVFVGGLGSDINGVDHWLIRKH